MVKYRNVFGMKMLHKVPAIWYTREGFLLRVLRPMAAE